MPTACLVSSPFLPPLSPAPVPWRSQANSIIQDIRRIVRNDTRTITKLHRRIFLDKINST